MARKRVTLAFIANDATRRATLKKRRKGLIKKVRELATLCDVKASIVIYGPHDTAPESWPSYEEARQIFAEFRSLPEFEQTKKQLNQETFLQQRAGKLAEHLRKTEQNNRDLELTMVGYELISGLRGMDDLGIEALMGLCHLLNGKLKSVSRMIEFAKLEEAQAAEAQATPSAVAPVDPGAQEQTNEAAAAAAMEALSRQRAAPEVLPPAEQIVDPYEDYGSPYIDPNFFDF